MSGNCPISQRVVLQVLSVVDHQNLRLGIEVVVVVIERNGNAVTGEVVSRGVIDGESSTGCGWFLVVIVGRRASAVYLTRHSARALAKSRAYSLSAGCQSVHLQSPEWAIGLVGGVWANQSACLRTKPATAGIINSQ